MGGLKGLLTLKVADKNGKTISEVTHEMKSFVLQFLQLLEAHMYPSVNVNIQDVTDTTKSVTKGTVTFHSEWAVTDDDRGIMVGIGTTPPTNTDVAMETKIVHGTGAGQLSYGATSKTTTTEVGANIDFVFTRTFNNGSGNTINVTETGIICIATNTTTYFLIAHDTFSAVAVANGQTLTVNYTLRTTV